MRKTSSTKQALERLASAMGVEVSRDGKLFIIHTNTIDGDLPIAKKSSCALAHLTFVASMREDFDVLRDATRYDPGVNRGSLLPDVPTHGLSGWESEYLTRLAVTEIS